MISVAAEDSQGTAITRSAAAAPPARGRSLRRSLAIFVAMIVAGVALVATAAAIGIAGLHQDWGIALRGQQQLRRIYEVGSHLTAARLALNSGGGSEQVSIAAANVQAAIARLDERFPGDLDDAGLDGGGDAPPTKLRDELRSAASALRAPDASIGPFPASALEPLDAAFADLAKLSAGIRTDVLVHEASAARTRLQTLEWVIGLSVVVAIATGVAGARMYRAILRPLDSLGGAVARLASGHLDERARPRGAREFVDLTGNFNRMADELSSLYRDLEEKVRAQSRDLARSERLASVGYLAAGVAHEINNPLSIIAGYSERLLRQIHREIALRASSATTAAAGRSNAVLDASEDAQIRAIEIICEEAFRCKGITDQLLLLARPAGGAAQAERVHLGDVASSTIAAIRGLPESRERNIRLEVDASREIVVVGREGELKQVVMNLIVNSINATRPGGTIDVAVRGGNDAAEHDVTLSVGDDGAGMDEQTLARAFEPFFTVRRAHATAQEASAERRGTGLGLSIVHAIVRDHGGSIVARSDGPDRGSTFEATFPAAGTPNDDKILAMTTDRHAHRSGRPA